MIAVAEELRRSFAVSVCVLDRRAGRPLAGAHFLGLLPVLAARFSTVTLAAGDTELRSFLAEVDAVIWYGLNDITPGALAAMPHRPRSLRVVHTDKEQEIEHHLRWRRVIDATCCVTPEMQRRIGGADFIPNTCSADRLRGRRRTFFAPEPPAGIAAPAPPTLGFLGRLMAFKNVAWLVERLEAFDCNLLVQGIDSDELTGARLAALAAASGVAHRLRFLPPAAAVGTLLRSVDAVVVLSPREGFPMVVVEAGMVGIPVIATRVGALPELFAGEILFVDADRHDPAVPDASSMRRALAALDPTWGLRLRAKLAPLCSRAAVAASYAERLRDLLGAAPADPARLADPDPRRSRRTEAALRARLAP